MKSQISRTMVSARNDHPAAVSAIHKAAAERLIGLTPYSTVIARALVAVAKVEQTMADMQKSGALKAMNREFKAAREAGLQPRTVHSFMRRSWRCWKLWLPGVVSAKRFRYGRRVLRSF
jgi:hypothetical protein